MTRDEIFTKVQEVLVDALGVDDDEVTTEARVQGDLGAESIDMLDITFKLEQAFGFKIEQDELLPAEAQDPEYVQDGKLTDAGLAKLKERMPFAHFEEFEKDPQVARVADIITVGTLVNFCDKKLQAA